MSAQTLLSRPSTSGGQRMFPSSRRFSRTFRRSIRLLTANNFAAMLASIVQFTHTSAVLVGTRTHKANLESQVGRVRPLPFRQALRASVWLPLSSNCTPSMIPGFRVRGARSQGGLMISGVIGWHRHLQPHSTACTLPRQCFLMTPGSIEAKGVRQELAATSRRV